MLDNNGVKRINVRRHLRQGHGSTCLLFLSVESIHCNLEKRVVAWERELSHCVKVRCHSTEHLCGRLTHRRIRITKLCLQVPARSFGLPLWVLPVGSVTRHRAVHCTPQPLGNGCKKERKLRTSIFWT